MPANENFYAGFARRVESAPTAACLVPPGGRTLSRAWLDSLSAQYAHVLIQAGLARGDRVAVQVEKSPQALALYLACLRAGFCYLPLNTAYQSAEVAYLIDNAEPRAIVGAPSKIEALAANAKAARLFTLDEHGQGTLKEAAQSAPDYFETARAAADDPAALLYTSGTTGRPKGALISHGAMTYCAATLGEAWRISAADSLLHTLPLFHGHGLFISSNVALITGARLLWRPRFDAAEVVATLPQATVFMGVPTYYHRLLADPGFDHAACRAMRLFTCGSAPLSAELHREFERRTGHRILERYGATEAMIIASNPFAGERRPGSVGRALPQVELRITDAEDRPLPTGEVGHILVRSPGLFTGYWRMPEQTACEFTPDGFFRTGDLGRLDAKGYLSITGRSKDLIISGGYNVYPAEVEDVLSEHAGVREAAVIGVPHPDFGEAVVALIIARSPDNPPEAAEILALAKRRLANFKIPKRVVAVADLPRNTMGKVQKNLLRQSYAHLFGGLA